MSRIIQLLHQALYVFSLLASAQCFALTRSDCLEKDISVYQWGVRHYAALPASLSVKPGATLETCVTLTGIGPKSLEITPKHYELSINGGTYSTGMKMQVNDNDTLRIRLIAPSKFNEHKTSRLEFFETDKTMRRNIIRLAWQVQTANYNINPTTWFIGTDKRYQQVSQVLPMVRGGDTIILNKSEVFEPFEVKFISGSKDQPITLTSNAQKAKERPRIKGGVPRFGWAIGLRSSHFWIIENLVIEDAIVCFRNESHGTLLSRVLIKGCHTGVMGTDYNAGSLTVSHSEITESGGKEVGQKWGHPIYVASDQHTFPRSEFVLKHSFLHNNKGNNVKSRYEKSRIYNNWIEAGKDGYAKYLLELIGYDGNYDFSGQEHIVQNNFLIHGEYGLGSRIGGDGKSPSRGTVTFENNLFVGKPEFEFPFIRIFQGLGRLNVQYNSIAYVAEATPNILIQDELASADWALGKPHISIKGNTINSMVTLLKTIENTSRDNQNSVSINNNRILAPLELSKQALTENRPQEGVYVLDIGVN